MPLESYPQRLTLLALSDLTRLFESYRTGSNVETRPSSNHVTHKLTFYAAHLLSGPHHRLVALAEECLSFSRHLEIEMGTLLGSVSKSSAKRVEKT
jgi:hypothetical protein